MTIRPSMYVLASATTYASSATKSSTRALCSSVARSHRSGQIYWIYQTKWIGSGFLGLSPDTDASGRALGPRSPVSFASWLFGNRLREAALMESMGKVACAYDCETVGCLQVA